MQFTSHTDIEAPIDFVYGVLSDFEAWERSAMRRGVELNRTERMRAPGLGMSWDLRFRFKGKPRELAVKLVELEPNARLGFKGEGRLMLGDLSVDLLALSSKRTRLTVNLGVTPRTLGARLFLQSVRLARARVQGKLNKRLEQFGLELEQRYSLPAR